MLDFVIFAATFLAALIIAIIWLYPSSKSVTTVPGFSPSSKEDGNMGDIARAGSSFEFLQEIHSKFGSITGFWWGQTYVVSIASPELLKEHSSAFDRPPFLFKSFEPLLGPKSIQYTNGSAGRSRRRTYDHVFGHESMAKYLSYFEEIAHKVEMKWSQNGKDDHIPLSDDTLQYAIQGATVSMFGDYFKDEKSFMDLQKSYKMVWSKMERTLDHNETLDAQQQQHFDKALEFLHSSIKDVVAHRKKGNLHLQGSLLLDILIENCSDEETLISDAITFLVGGFHTSANLLQWALYYLATHKEVQGKLYKEIKKVIGDKGSVDQHNYSEFVYMLQVIDETLRCSVIAPWVARVQDFDSELGGHKIPKNTPVIHALGVVLKDEKLWPLPNNFDPERFSPEKRKKMSTYDFVPFGFAGKRKCPGYRVAYWDSVVFLAVILRRFEIHMCDNQVVKPVYGIVTHPEDEIWVKVTKRK